MSRKAAETAEEELQRWRGWAQFVYLGGGPITLSDVELRAAVCAEHDQQVQEVRDQLEFTRGELKVTEQRAENNRQAAYLLGGRENP